MREQKKAFYSSWKSTSLLWILKTGILTFAFLLLSGCSGFFCGKAPRKKKVLYTTVTDGSGPFGTKGENVTTLSGDEMDRIATDVPIPLEPGSSVVTSLRQDLNLDGTIEQLLIIRRSQAEAASLFLVLAASDSGSKEEEGIYTKSANVLLQATQHNPLTLYTQDITGDHYPEIIVIGTDSEKRQTMEIFAGDHSSRVLTLREIFNKTVDGVIDLIEKERSAAYQFGGGGEYFPIVSEENDKHQEDGVVGLIRISYQWVPSEKKYIPAGEERIPIKKVKASQLKALLKRARRSPTVFEEFINGFWYRVGDENEGNVEIVDFQQAARKIVFYDGSALSFYDWNTSFKATYRGLRIHMKNNLVLDNNTIYLTVEDLGQINLKILSKFSKLDGTYRRIPPSFQAKLLTKNEGLSALKVSPVKGTFKSDQDVKLTFSSPTFLLEEKNSKTRGFFSFFLIESDHQILELQFLDQHDDITKTKVYKIDLKENPDEKKTVRYLTLYPGRLTISGFSPDNSTPFLFFSQTEPNEVSS